MPKLARPHGSAPIASITLKQPGNSIDCVMDAASTTLPIFEFNKGGHLRQFVTSGSTLSTVDLRPGKKLKANNPVDFMEIQSRRLQNKFRAAFLPEAEGVSDEYYDYCRWRFVQRIASSALSVLATQQMLFAVGLGAKRALPTAAALNWVLKDGLGRLGKLTVATNFGRRFDADIKRFRFTSSLIYDASAGIEILTPLFPQHFLLLATLANVGKSIGVTTANVVRAPIQMSFSLKANLADIAARTSAQQVLADNLGLAGAVVMTAWVSRMPRARAMLPFAMYPLLAAADLSCIHAELKCVQLKTINKERGEIIAEHWLDKGRAPTFAEVASEEYLLFPPTHEEGALPLQIRPLSFAVHSMETLKEVVASRHRVGGEPGRYFLTYQNAQMEDNIGVKTWRLIRKALPAPGKKLARWRGRAMLALHEDYRPADVLTALLQVSHLRRLPYRKDMTAEQACTWAMEESLSRARKDFPKFVHDIKDQGWQCDQILLSSAEKVTFKVEGGLESLEKKL